MRTYEKGRSTEGWERGDEVLNVSQVKPGDVLIGLSHQFKSENLYRVVPCPFENHIHDGEGFYVKYVNPDLTKVNVGPTDEQWIWNFMLNSEQQAWYIAKELPRTLPVEPTPVTFTLEDHSEGLFEGERKATVTVEKFADGSIGLKIPGYGDCGSADGYGCPVILEYWEGRLRLIAFADINTEDPTIIDLEGARESNRPPEEVPCT